MTYSGGLHVKIETITKTHVSFTIQDRPKVYEVTRAKFHQMMWDCVLYLASRAA
jgi:hypothetical protein